VAQAIAEIIRQLGNFMHLGFWNFYNFFNNNRMFTSSSSFLNDDIGYPMVHLGNHLRKLGHQVATLDTDDLEKFDKIFFLDYPTKLNPYFRKLLRKKHPDINLILIEPPIVRADNYNPKKHAPFKRVLTWKNDLCQRDPEKYKHYFLPNKLRADTPALPFAQRKLCVLINSFMYSTDRRELYSERIRAIHWFEKNAPKDFDLIGMNWDKPFITGKLSVLNFPLRFAYRRVGFLKKLKVKQFPSFIGPNKKSKHLTLQDYRFCLAYENSIEPDYISEKLFDCFFAGIVPIYLGAPDVSRWIPSNTFIDKTHFATYAELHKFLAGMSQAEYQKYLDAIRDFIHSPRITPFTAENFAESFTKAFIEN
jgi:hypothetical protein